MIALAAAAAAPAILAATAAPVLAPPLDRPMRLVTEQVRTSRVEMRFVAERRVVFRRIGAQLVAEVTLLRVEATGPDEVRQNYRLALAPMIGRLLRFRLSPDGRVTGMEDGDAAWAAFVAGRRAMIPARGPAAPPAARRPDTTLDGVAPADRAPLLAEALVPVLAPADGALAAGSRATTLAQPGSAPLAGTRHVLHDFVGRIVIETEAASPDGATTLHRRRVVDPVTGLVGHQRETVVRRLGTATLTTVSETTLG